MNRFAASGIAAAAASGDRIFVVTMNARESRDAFDAICETAESPLRIVRVNGRERVDFPSGGWVVVRSFRQRAGRGMSADTVFLDAGVDAELSFPRDYDELCPIVASSPRGEIIRA